MPEAVLYHGSGQKIRDQLQPRSSRVLNEEKAVFATPSRDTAVSFIPRWRDRDFEHGRINDHPYMREQYAGAFEKLLRNRSGYLYHLPEESFRSDSRLMSSERIADSPVTIRRRERIKDVLRELQQARRALIAADGQSYDGRPLPADVLQYLKEQQKQASLKDDVQLQPHQQRIADEARKEPLRKLLLWGLGSGKTLGSLAAAESHGQPYTAVVPAALRGNYQQELSRFTDGRTPAEVLSYSQLALGRQPRYPDSLVFDEAHRLRNPEGRAAQAASALAQKARQVVLLSGTPLTNRPGDLAGLIGLLQKKSITPQQFEERYLAKKKVYPSLWQSWVHGMTPGEVEVPANLDELRAMLKGKVDYYQPEQSVVPVSREDVPVTMSDAQSLLYKSMWQKLPYITRWKLQRDFPLSSDELLKLQAFLSGPRQVSLSTYPYLAKKDPYKAYEQSPKLQKALELLQKKLHGDERAKALVFSNFIDAGLRPYASALERAGIPHGLFHGGLNDKERKRLVDDYNNGKLRVALIGPSGMEGLSFKGTQLLQQLDPHFHPVRPRQAEGRALRYDSHDSLPEELRHVHVQRFISRLPPGLTERLKSLLLWRDPQDAEASDDQLLRLSQQKEQVNQPFLELLRQAGQPSRKIP